MVEKWQFTMTTNHWLLSWRNQLQILLWDSSECSAESWDMTSNLSLWKDKLSVSGGIVYRNDRIVVPVALRKTLIVKLHQEHMGTESTLRRARTSLWWPNMNNQLKQFIATCEVCNAFQTNYQTMVQSRFWYFRVAERTLSSNWLALTVTELNLTWRETEVLLISSIWCKNSLQDGEFPRASSQTVERITTSLNSHSSVNETTSNTPNLHLITARAMETLNLLWRL